jgi:hypothetical protein
VLLFVVDQDEEGAIVVIERVDAHKFSRPSTRGGWKRSIP